MDLEPRAVLNKVFDSFGADAVERALLFQVNNPVGCVAWAHCFLTTLGVERLVPEQLNLSPREYNYALTCLRLTGPLNASQLKGIAYAYVENARRLRQTLRKLSPGAVNV